MALVAVRDQIATYFGGPYVPRARAYLTPQVPGLGVVKRSRGARQPKAAMHEGMDTDRYGTAMLVRVMAGHEEDVTLPGHEGGWKRAEYGVRLELYLHSGARYPEDAEDAFTGLVERLMDRIRADRTLGSGGFDKPLDDGSPNPAGMQVTAPGQVAWEMSPIETLQAITRAFGVIDLAVAQYIQAPAV